jgi:hypothetical protein
MLTLSTCCDIFQKNPHFMEILPTCFRQISLWEGAWRRDNAIVTKTLAIIRQIMRRIGAALTALGVY